MYDEMEMNNVTETTDLVEAAECGSDLGKGMLYGMGIAGAIYGAYKLVKWGVKKIKAKQSQEVEADYEVKDVVDAEVVEK